MIARSGGIQLEELAHRSFLLITRMMLGLPRARRRNSSDLKEMEFMTLAALHQHQTMIVGDIQRILGVLPAQMSRIIRSLESRSTPLVACQINPKDKRKIDVQLTPAGEQVLAEYVLPRVRAISDLLSHLNDEERESLGHLLDRLHSLTDAADQAIS
jgi:DNA-binding MarR family transcriptional regulator